MKRNKRDGFILLCCGLVIIAAGLFIYAVVHSIYPNSDSSRVQDLNKLLTLFGKTGTAVLVSAVGLLFVILGLKKLNRKF